MDARGRASARAPRPLCCGRPRPSPCEPSEASAYCTIQTHYRIWWLPLWFRLKWHFYCESIFRLAAFSKSNPKPQNPTLGQKAFSCCKFLSRKVLSSQKAQINLCYYLNPRNTIWSIWPFLCNLIFHSVLKEFLSLKDKIPQTTPYPAKKNLTQNLSPPILFPFSPDSGKTRGEKSYSSPRAGLF